MKRSVFQAGKEIFSACARKGNARGFNLFSALVAAVLLATSVVLVNTLVATEDRMSNQLYGMFNNYQLSDAANLARADALQSFNYNFRKQLEDYLTYNDYELEKEPGMSLINMDNYSDWAKIKKTFEEVILLTKSNEGQKFDAALEYVANRTIDNFTEGSYGRYHVGLSSKTTAAKNAVKTAMSEAVAAQAAEAAAGKSSILEVVGCDCTNPGDDAGNCPTGTFYFNLPLNKITDARYEALPRIVVKDLITGEEMKIAILPRTNLKIYIPLRFFKALCEATRNAKAVKEINAELSTYRLGFCNSCNPKDSPTEAPSGTSWATHGCPTGEEGAVTLSDKPSSYNAATYYPGGGRPGAPALAAYSIDALCREGLGMNIGTGSEAFANNGTINGLSARALPDNMRNISGCPFYKITPLTIGVKNKLVDTTTSYLYCSQIYGITADVMYEEKDPQYIVSGDSFSRCAVNTICYNIRISDEAYSRDNEGSGKCATSVDASLRETCVPA